MKDWIFCIGIYALILHTVFGICLWFYETIAAGM